MEGKIISKSSNCIAYILAKNYNKMTIEDNLVIDKDTGNLLYCLNDDAVNRYYYNTYKEAFAGEHGLEVDLKKFLKNYSFLIKLTKAYKENKKRD